MNIVVKKILKQLDKLAGISNDDAAIIIREVLSKTNNDRKIITTCKPEVKNEQANNT